MACNGKDSCDCEKEVCREDMYKRRFIESEAQVAALELEIKALNLKLAAKDYD